jgi:hypothetical protein
LALPFLAFAGLSVLAGITFAVYKRTSKRQLPRSTGGLRNSFIAVQTDEYQMESGMLDSETEAFLE